MTAVYRAPMRSRNDRIDSRATIERARTLGVCGFGQLTNSPSEHERLNQRVARFVEVPEGSFVWTRDPDGLFWLGRICGAYYFDADDAAVAVDLVHVRACEWARQPLLEPDVPAAVVETFGRGGRNFQQTHHPSLSAATQSIWERI